LLVFRFQCFDATVYTVNKVVQHRLLEVNETHIRHSWDLTAL